MIWIDESIRRRKEPAPDVPVGGPRKRKDTRRWCKGKVGREHLPAPQRDTSGWRACAPRPLWWTGRSHWFYGASPWWCNHQMVCVVCGKILERRIDPTDCPDRHTSGVST